PISPGESAMRDARYRTLYDIQRRYRVAFRLAWDSPSLAMASREPWQLYEIWCFLRVAEALRQLGWRMRGGDCVRWARGRLHLALARGRAPRLQFERNQRRVTLFYNRQFPSAVAGSADAVSLTHAMIPDICLEMDWRLMILDAKFREFAEPTSEQDDIIK